MENNRTNFDLKLGQFGPNEADADAEAKKMAEFGRGQGRGLGRFLPTGGTWRRTGLKIVTSL